jgi:steroid delta-isomerase-like uncharacterized protein
MSQQTLVDAAKAPSVAFSTKDWEAVADTFAPDISYEEVATHRTARGLADVMALWQGWAQVSSDSAATFEAAHVSGSTVVLELSWRGTHTGPLETPAGPIPATGRAIDLRACQIVDVSDGKVRSIRQYFDMETLLAQLGVGVVAA